jgi:hypothetical protein
MLSLEDCVALCELSEEEVLAIAEHEHIPQLVAVELGNYLVQSADGQRRIRSMIRDDLLAARARGERDRVLALKLVLRDYVLAHPACH